MNLASLCKLSNPVLLSLQPAEILYPLIATPPKLSPMGVLAQVRSS